MNQSYQLKNYDELIGDLEDDSRKQAVEIANKTSNLTLNASNSNKQIKIRKKPENIIQKLLLKIPQSFNHVYNLLNMIGINERALRDVSYQQSYFKSMFYIKNIEKVEVRKNAIVIYTKNIEQDLTSIGYLIERYRSFGDNNFYQLANIIEKTYQLYANTSITPEIIKYFDQPLSTFIEFMRDRIYMCKVAPNKIVISRKLLQFLGEDPELYALKLSKYKIPFREIISAESYLKVIVKSIQVIGLVSAFLKNDITLQELRSKAYMQFTDNLYTKDQRKVFCKLSFSLPTPIINCIELIQQFNSTDEFQHKKVDVKQRKYINQECDQKKYLQAQTLKYLIPVPKGLLMGNSKKQAGYYLKEDAMQNEQSYQQ